METGFIIGLSIGFAMVVILGWCIVRTIGNQDETDKIFQDEIKKRKEAENEKSDL